MLNHLKPGTLAQIKKSEGHPECVGWIVTVVRPTMTTVICSELCSMPHSRIAHPPLAFRGLTESDIPSAWLRPINGDDTGVDQMVRIAGPAPVVERVHAGEGHEVLTEAHGLTSRASTANSADSDNRQRLSIAVTAR